MHFKHKSFHHASESKQASGGQKWQSWVQGQSQ